jgi:hypothetical protein
MQTARLYTRLWVKASTLRRAKFLETIRQNESVLNDKFFEQIAKQRSSATGMRLKLFTIQIPILAFLVLSLIPIEASFSVLGISPGSNKNLREILVIVSAIIGIGSCFINYYVDVLTEILGAYAERRSKGKKDVEEMFKVSYALDIFPLPPRNHGHIQLGWGFAAFLVIIVLLLLVLSACLILGGFYIHVMMRDIYYKPSFSTTVSVWVIAFVVACDALSMLVIIANSGVLITRNYTNMMAVSKMSHEKAQGVYRRMWERHYRKPLLLRMVTRAKLPQKLD